MQRILVIDDDLDLCDAVRLVLENENYEVRAAQTKEQGRRAVDEYQPDLIVLDVMMEQPDDGFVLAQELKQAGYTKPILMLTNVGHVSGMTFDKDEEMVPVDEFYEKPISPARLVEVVQRLLRK